MSHKTRLATEQELDRLLKFIEQDAYLHQRSEHTEEFSLKDSQSTKNFMEECLKNNPLNVTEFEGSNLSVYHTNIFTRDEEGHVNMFDCKYLYNRDRDTFEDIEDCDFFVA